MDYLKEALICKLCNQISNQPVFLPCHKTLCQIHLDEELLKANNTSFQCYFCSKQHEIAFNGFKINEKPNQPAAAADPKPSSSELKLKLDKSSLELSQLYEDFLKKDPELKSFNSKHFLSLREQINAKRDELKQEIEALANKMLDLSDRAEVSCFEVLSAIRTDSSRVNKDEFKRIEAEIRHELKRPKLHKSKINEIKAELSEKKREFKERLGILENIKSNTKQSRFEPMSGELQLGEDFLGELILVNKLISCSEDKTIRVWNLNSGSCMRTLAGHADSVFCLQTLENGEIASISFDKTIKLWHVQTGKCLDTLEHSNNGYCFKQLSKHEFVVGSSDGLIRIVDFSTGLSAKEVGSHSGWVTCLEMLPNGQLASSSLDKTIKVWDLNSGKCLATLYGHSHYVNSVKVLGSGQIASSSSDKTVRILINFI
jgi:WD40 repeat protein